MKPCQRCHTLSDSLSEGSLALCPACPLLPPCGEYQHDYRAAHPDLLGAWVCLNCGQLLTSILISTEPVAAPQAPAMDFDC